MKVDFLIFIVPNVILKNLLASVYLIVPLFYYFSFFLILHSSQLQLKFIIHFSLLLHIVLRNDFSHQNNSNLLFHKGDLFLGKYKGGPIYIFNLRISFCLFLNPCVLFTSK